MARGLSARIKEMRAEAKRKRRKGTVASRRRGRRVRAEEENSFDLGKKQVNCIWKKIGSDYDASSKVFLDTLSDWMSTYNIKYSSVQDFKDSVEEFEGTSDYEDVIENMIPKSFEDRLSWLNFTSSFYVDKALQEGIAIKDTDTLLFYAMALFYTEVAENLFNYILNMSEQDLTNCLFD